jgi:dolichol-phosphate mannosyltransferase
MNLSIIIPLYNESENVSALYGNIVPVLEGLIQNKYPLPEAVDSIELVFVDDGSTDETSSFLRECFDPLSNNGTKIRYRSHPKNLGLGAALRTGFSSFSGDVVITTDSDGTYHFSTIPELLSCLTPEVDIVTASPYHPSGKVVGVPPSRLLLSRGSSLIYRLLVDWNLHTYTALYRVYRRQVVESITFKSNGFLAGTELIVKAIFSGKRVGEYPATLHRRVYGISKAKIIRTIMAHLNFQALILLHRLGFRSLIKMNTREPFD